jgi:hypothetical protein
MHSVNEKPIIWAVTHAANGRVIYSFLGNKAKYAHVRTDCPHSDERPDLFMLHRNVPGMQTRE